jgi:predicted methyltransferase
MPTTIYTPAQLDAMSAKGYITEYVAKAMYPWSQALRRMEGSLPKDLTPGGTLVLEEHKVRSEFSGRKTTRYMIVSIVKPTGELK